MDVALQRVDGLARSHSIVKRSDPFNRGEFGSSILLGVTSSIRRGGLNRSSALAAPAFVHAKGFAPNACLRAMELGPAESQSQRASKKITVSADRRGRLSLAGRPDDFIVPIRGQTYSRAAVMLARVVWSKFRMEVVGPRHR